jgi:hypothetical protein
VLGIILGIGLVGRIGVIRRCSVGGGSVLPHRGPWIFGPCIVACRRRLRAGPNCYRNTNGARQHQQQRPIKSSSGDHYPAHIVAGTIHRFFAQKYDAPSAVALFQPLCGMQATAEDVGSFTGEAPLA